MANIRQFYALNTSDKNFSMLDDEQKALVEGGFKVAKQYMAERMKDSKKDLFAAINDTTIDSRKELNDMVVEKIAKYSAKRAGGINVENFALADVANPNVHNDPIFKRTFAAVLAQIMTPVVPAMISTSFMDFADVANIGWGDTARFKVNSNDTFFVTRLAEGILHGSVQRTYNNEITVNPEPYNIMTAVDWYQVAAGMFDLGEFVYKVGISYNAYITQMVIQAIGANITANAGTSYIVNGFSTSTFVKLAEILRAANGGAKIRAYGTLAALSNVIPSGTTNANLQMGLGEEWARVGHLGTFMDVDLVRIPQILLPNTVNTTPLTGIPDSTIYLFAEGGYKPVKLVFEGSALTTDIVPTEAPDKEMGISLTLRMGTTFIAASKYGAITGVSA